MTDEELIEALGWEPCRRAEPFPRCRFRYPDIEDPCKCPASFSDNKPHCLDRYDRFCVAHDHADPEECAGVMGTGPTCDVMDERLATARTVMDLSRDGIADAIWKMGRGGPTGWAPTLSPMEVVKVVRAWQP